MVQNTSAIIELNRYYIRSKAGTYGISHDLGAFSGENPEQAIANAVNYYTLMHDQSWRPFMLEAELIEK